MDPDQWECSTLVPGSTTLAMLVGRTPSATICRCTKGSSRFLTRDLASRAGEFDPSTLTPLPFLPRWTVNTDKPLGKKQRKSRIDNERSEECPHQVCSHLQPAPQPVQVPDWSGEFRSDRSTRGPRLRCSWRQLSPYHKDTTRGTQSLLLRALK